MSRDLTADLAGLLSVTGRLLTLIRARGWGAERDAEEAPAAVRDVIAWADATHNLSTLGHLLRSYVTGEEGDPARLLREARHLARAIRAEAGRSAERAPLVAETLREAGTLLDRVADRVAPTAEPSDQARIDETALDLAQPWRPISEAVKGGPAIWARLRSDLSLRTGRPALNIWDGVQVPLRHPGTYTDEEGRVRDHGWNVAAPVGHGGFPDDWIAGWVPLRGSETDLAWIQSDRTGPCPY